MDRQVVDSSNLKSVGYDERRRQLEVEFEGGSVYRYSGVPVEEYDALLAATSPGSYFQNFVRSRFEFVKVG
jgi:hypothetical protein